MTGAGTRKVTCAECGRRVPPQDVAGHRPVCTDCRTYAPPEHKPKPVVTVAPLITAAVLGLPGVSRVALERMVPVRPAVTLARTGYGPSATFSPAVELPEPGEDGYDGSGFGEVAEAMAAVDYADVPDPLPSENDEDLKAALRGFAGDVEGFAAATGDERAEAVQRYRRAAYARDVRAGRVT